MEAPAPGRAGAPQRWRGVIEEYRSYLSVTADTPIVTLLEGGTPLVRADRMARHLPDVTLYLNTRARTPPAPSRTAG